MTTDFIAHLDTPDHTGYEEQTTPICHINKQATDVLSPHLVRGACEEVL